MVSISVESVSNSASETNHFKLPTKSRSKAQTPTILPLSLSRSFKDTLNSTSSTVKIRTSTLSIFQKRIRSLFDKKSINFTAKTYQIGASLFLSLKHATIYSQNQSRFIPIIIVKSFKKRWLHTKGKECGKSF